MEPTITVYVVASDGALLDVIEDVDLGNRIEALENGRTTLNDAVLWGCVEIKFYEEGRWGSSSDGGL